MQATISNTLLIDTEQFIVQFFEDKIPPTYVFHDLDHTKGVVEAALLIAQGYDLSEQELECLQLAAWFHDTGYTEGPKNHEERSCSYAQSFLKTQSYSAEAIEQVCQAIRATKPGQPAKNLLQQILKDADLSHLGRHHYWDRCGRLRQELTITQEIIMSEQEWVEFELAFMNTHEFLTHIARELYTKPKAKHIRILRKRRAELYADKDELKRLAKEKKSKKKKGKKGKTGQLKDIPLGRGVETMYRTTYRTHVNLSSIADNKANIMLSINAIIISIVVSTLVPQFANNRNLIIPTLILLAVCLVSVIYATLSTRPKVTEGRFTREDIEQKRSNLLFFGNYYNMELGDFHWGMMEMIKDSNFLYSSMTRDLYFLGKVLAQKYRYLSICYGIFMYGLVIAVAAFAIAFIFFPAEESVGF